MIEIKYDLMIIDSIDKEELKELFNNVNVEYKEHEDEFFVTIDSMQKYKTISAVLCRHIINIKWEECFEEVFEEIFKKDYDSILEIQKQEINKIKNYKRLEILTKKTIDEYLTVKDNETLNISSFLMFNMDGFEEYLKAELLNIDFESLEIDDEIKNELIEQWERKGIFLKDYKYLYILKKNDSYVLFNTKGQEISFKDFTDKMGFNVENSMNIKNEVSKYLTMILNISSFMDSKKIYIDEIECKELADLLCSNISFEGNHAQISLSSRNMIIKMLDGLRGM